MADKDAVALVGGHTNPILGADEVKLVLNDCREASSFPPQSAEAGQADAASLVVELHAVTKTSATAESL